MCSVNQVTLEDSIDLHKLAVEVVQKVSDGKIVLIPTETQYGLCCNAENSDAVRSLNLIKNRSTSQPTAIFVRDWKHASPLVKSIPDHIERFLSHFWPGPLTVVARSSRSDWFGVVTERGTIGLRNSLHPLVSEIVGSSPFYLTATSANRHGEFPSADTRFLTNWLADDIELFIFDTMIRQDVPASTVTDISGGFPRIVRTGGIDSSVIIEAWHKEIGVE